jgi:hypothetical protein
MPMKQIAFRIPEELESKIPKPSLEGERTKFLRDLIEVRVRLDNSLALYDIDKPKRNKARLEDSDLITIRDADPDLESVLQELQYLRNEIYS